LVENLNMLAVVLLVVCPTDERGSRRKRMNG
jgi:hypothetical protein